MQSPLISSEVFRIGFLAITRPVLTTWVLMAAIVLASRQATRRLNMQPSRLQAALELLVSGMVGQIEEVMGRDGRPFLPLLGTLFLFLLAANTSGLLPGVEAPTTKLETTAALAVIVFASVHFFGIRAHWVGGYLAGFAKPVAIMLPLNLLSEVTRHFSLMVRLFGNIMSGEFIIAIVVALAGLFVPIPLMALELLVGVVQAYIFTMLATVFIGAAVGGIEAG